MTKRSNWASTPSSRRRFAKASAVAEEVHQLELFEKGLRPDHWLRLFYPDGSLVPTKEERVEQERQKAEQERQRADAAERELAHLRARLDDPTGSDA